MLFAKKKKRKKRSPGINKKKLIKAAAISWKIYKAVKK
jgi:hypothetical protein